MSHKKLLPIYIIAFGVLIFCFGLVCGITYERYRYQIHHVQETSAMMSLESIIVENLRDYKQEHGSYPENLSELEIHYAESDGAHPEILKRYFYKNCGENYILFWDETANWE